MKIGDVVHVEIESVAFGGDGVGRIHNLVIFIPFTVDGDFVAAQIVALRKRYARGKLREIIRPSACRIEPLCGYYTRCGGCQMQHVRYERQLEIKQRQVGEIFQRIGGFSRPMVSEIIPSPMAYHYRGKAEIHLRRKRGAAPILGFMHALTHEIIDMERCEIVDESINEDWQNLRGETDIGSTRSILRERRVLWSHPRDKGSEDAMPGFLPSRHVLRSVKNRMMMVPRAGFFQANQALVDQLVDRVIDMCRLRGHETVIDGYCGSGLFCLFLAPQARRLYGIETDPDSVCCAAVNLRHAGYDHAAFIQGDVTEVMGKSFPPSGMSIDLVIIDPPRTGCDQALLLHLGSMKPQRLIYVSCNPSTQARDIRFLCERGFSLTSLQPIDMFPQTGHIEVIGLLEANR